MYGEVLEPLQLHPDVVEHRAVAPAGTLEHVLHRAHAAAGHGPEPSSLGELVKHLELRRPVAPAQVDAAHPDGVENAPLAAFHGEGATDAEGDGVHAVGVAVVVRLQHPIGIEDAAVGPERGAR